MRTTYMGIFSAIFGWIFKAILGPIVKFVAKILSPVIKWIFNVILKPILELVLKIVLPWVLELLKNIFASIFYAILAYLCTIIEYLERAFNIFAGVSNVTFDGKSMTLLSTILSFKEIRTIFIWIFGVGFGMAMIFSIIAIIKSTIDLDFENKRPVGAVLRALLKTVIQFLFIQLMVIFIISLGSIVLKTVNSSISIASSGKSPDTTLGRICFCVASLNASKNDAINSDNCPSGQYQGKDILYAGERGNYYKVNGYKMSDVDKAEKYFKLEKFDYITGYIVAIFLIIILIMAALAFVQRIFSIVILYLVCPFFVSTMPLDDGEKFKKWKSMFIGTVFSGYGIVLAMKLYLMLVPVIITNQIQFTSEGTFQSGTAAYLFKMIFLIGGAWSLTKVGPMITTLIDAQAGRAEEANVAAVSSVSGAALGALGSGALSLTKAGLGAAGGVIAAPIGQLFGGAGKAEGDKRMNNLKANQEKDFPTDGKDGKGNKADISGKGSGGGSSSKGGSDDKKSDKGDISEKKESKDEEKDKDKELGESKELEGEKGKDGEGGQAADIKDKPEGAKDEKDEKGNKMDDKKEEDSDKPKLPEKNKFDKFMGFCHRVLPHKSNPDGSYSFGFLGFRVNYNKDGKRTGFKVPCVNFKYGKDGKAHVEKANFLGIAKIQRSEKTGKFGLSSIPMIGLKREEGKDGGFHTTKLGLVGMNRQADDRGGYHLSSVAGLKFGMAYNKEKDSYEVKGCRIGNMVFGGDTSDPALKDKKKE